MFAEGTLVVRSPLGRNRYEQRYLDRFSFSLSLGLPSRFVKLVSPNGRLDMASRFSNVWAKNMKK